MDVFPPQERHTVDHAGGQVTGQKTFTYFLVPRQDRPIPLADCFQWIYFDPTTTRYDTLRSDRIVQVGGPGAAPGQTRADRSSVSAVSEPPNAPTANVRSIYAGIDALDSTHQPINGVALTRLIANVLVVVMLLGMIFVFFKR